MTEEDPASPMPPNPRPTSASPMDSELFRVLAILATAAFFYTVGIGL